MSSIWDNTYTLGNSSGTVISAGPGIKIDDTSQPGVIKVSNDETVLWSGSIYDAGASANLSESYKNFNRLGITYNIQEASDISGYVEIPTDGSKYNITHNWCSFTDNTLGVFFTNLTANSNTTLSVNRHTHVYVSNNATTLNRGTNGLVIREIRGINRKQNGGN